MVLLHKHCLACPLLPSWSRQRCTGLSAWNKCSLQSRRGTKAAHKLQLRFSFPGTCLLFSPLVSPVFIHSFVMQDRSQWWGTRQWCPLTFLQCNRPGWLASYALPPPAAPKKKTAPPSKKNLAMALLWCEINTHTPDKDEYKIHPLCLVNPRASCLRVWRRCRNCNWEISPCSNGPCWGFEKFIDYL